MHSIEELAIYTILRLVKTYTNSYNVRYLYKIFKLPFVENVTYVTFSTASRERFVEFL